MHNYTKVQHFRGNLVERHLYLKSFPSHFQTVVSTPVFYHRQMAFIDILLVHINIYTIFFWYCNFRHHNTPDQSSGTTTNNPICIYFHVLLLFGTFILSSLSHGYQIYVNPAPSSKPIIISAMSSCNFKSRCTSSFIFQYVPNLLIVNHNKDIQFTVKVPDELQVSRTKDIPSNLYLIKRCTHRLYLSPHIHIVFNAYHIPMTKMYWHYISIRLIRHWHSIIFFQIAGRHWALFITRNTDELHWCYSHIDLS